MKVRFAVSVEVELPEGSELWRTENLLTEHVATFPGVTCVVADADEVSA